MVSSLFPPLVARVGQSLFVLGVARISTLNQDERSLADQEALLRRWLEQHYGGPFELRMVATQGSGERLDREESARIEQAIQSRSLDLVLTEDLGRIFRRIHACLLCELCEDYQTRLIALNDHVDTGRGDWHLAAIFSALKHESSNKDTSERIKRTLRNRFTQGGIVQTTIYGYIKPKDAKTDAELSKDPKAASIYDEWFTRLEGGASFSEIADWLNDRGIPVGPYSRREKWNGGMVARITMNPILKGERRRNTKMSVRVNATGRRKSVKAPPQDLLTRHCPHLAFIDQSRYDRIIRLVRARNRKCTRDHKGTLDCRHDVPRKRTLWPGQHATCGTCGRLYYWGGHGQPQHMMCSGAREYRCWNAITFDGVEAAQILSHAILAEIETLPGYDSVLLSKVKAKWDVEKDSRAGELAKLSSEIKAIDRQLDRVTEAIAQVGLSPALTEKLRDLEFKHDQLLRRQDDLHREPHSEFPLPPIDELKRLAKELMARQVANSSEFYRVMKKLVPSLIVSPYRLCDGGHIVLRAKVMLNLAALAPTTSELGDLAGVLRRELTVDLFHPPQRETYRKQVVALRAAGHEEWKIAEQLGITVTAAQRAARLQRIMDERGLTDPYEPVTEPPSDYARLRRHLHPRYRFEPLNLDTLP
jgi:DNA invertase Pin-like site-specific DNA recombinase